MPIICKCKCKWDEAVYSQGAIQALRNTWMPPTTFVITYSCGADLLAVGLLVLVVGAYCYKTG